MVFLLKLAAGFFRRNQRSEGAAEGGCGENSAAPERFAERSEAGQVRFRFLDLCIKFGKMISKACPVGNSFSSGVCEGFNSGANKLDTNSFFEDEKVRSPSRAFGAAGLASARATPALFAKLKRILMLSGEFNFFFLTINNTKL
jgi:hypothetical protein